MDYALALAFAAVSKSLCIFTGAGFSKAVAKEAPSWADMLESACAYLKNPADALEQFNKAKGVGLPLEDCAQALELIFRREDKNLRTVLAEEIGKLALDEKKAGSCKAFLSENKSVSWITTNYDDLLSEIVGSRGVVINYPGKPLATSDGCVHAYYIHGHIKNPAGLVVTTTDYYNFINRGDYFAQKTLTLLSEKTVAVLGYSLNDPNLKAILNELKSMGMRSLQRGNIYYVTRDEIPRFIRDHYEASYGITVVDKKEMSDFFHEVSAQIGTAKDRFGGAEEGLEKVLDGSAIWKIDYLKLRDSLFHIFGVANVKGINVLEPRFVKMLSDILAQKIGFTKESGAWGQYEHLADWLIYLGSVIEIEGSELHDVYLGAVIHSMSTMTSSQQLGYSWYAYGVWKNKWELLNLNNRIMIERHVNNVLSVNKDAMFVVSQV